MRKSVITALIMAILLFWVQAGQLTPKKTRPRSKVARRPFAFGTADPCPIFSRVRTRLTAWRSHFRSELKLRLRSMVRNATRMPIVDRDNANLQITRAKHGGLLLTLWVSLH